MPEHGQKGALPPLTIKKYANRRLYNTATSAYVTLDYLANLVREGQDFSVFDARSGEDITRSVLTQIIFEEESKGDHMLPVSFLRNIIGLYGDKLQSFVPSYLEMTMENFQKNQEGMRKSISEAISNTTGFKLFEDTARQNMAMFDQGMKLFGVGPPASPSPWSKRRLPQASPDSAQRGTAENEAAKSQPAAADQAARIEALEAEITLLKKELGRARSASRTHRTRKKS